jgi:hypothetical protein
MSKKGGVRAHALDQTVWPERHLLDIGRHPQRGEDDLALRAGSGTRVTFQAGPKLIRDRYVGKEARGCSSLFCKAV